MAITSDSGRVCRRAGLLECYHIARQNVKLDSCVVVAARFVPVSSQPLRLTKEKVYAAAVHALQTHLALSVRVVRAGSGKTQGTSTKKSGSSKEVYVYERLESVNLEKAIRFLDEQNTPKLSETVEDIAALIQKEFTKPFPSVSEFDAESDSDRLLWRLTVTPGNHLIFAYHHCIADGQSGLAALRTLLEGLNMFPSTETEVTFDPLAVKVPTDLKLTPPLEELTDLSVPFRTIIAGLAGLVVPPSCTSARKTWTGNPAPSTPGVFNTRTRLLSVPPESAKQILGEARKRGTTLTGVLYILGLETLSKLVVEELSEKDRRRYKMLAASIAVSLRPLTNVPPTAMGELVSAYRFTTPLRLLSSSSSSTPTPAVDEKDASISAEFDWEAAAVFSKKLRAIIPKTRKLTGVIKYLCGRYEGFFLGKLGKKKEGSLEISNLGAFKIDSSSSSSNSISSKPPDASSQAAADTNTNSENTENDSYNWTITETYFAQDDGVIGSAIKVSAVGSPSGSVNICITWGKGAVDDQFAEAFVSELGGAIGRLDTGGMSLS